MATSTDLRRRLARLEAARAPMRTGGVVTFDPATETPLEAVMRSGRRGACVVMPMPVVDAEEWERQTVASQRALLVRAAAVAAGSDPGL